MSDEGYAQRKTEELAVKPPEGAEPSGETADASLSALTPEESVVRGTKGARNEARPLQQRLREALGKAFLAAAVASRLRSTALVCPGRG